MLHNSIQLPPLSIHSSRVISRLSKTPYTYSRPSSRLVFIPDPPFPISQPPSRPASFRPSLIEDVLSLGDLVGEGSLLQGETLRLVPIGPDITSARSLDREPATEFRAVSRLGTGSYAVVYLVQEVLSRPPPSEDGHMFTIGQMESDGDKPFHDPEIIYGREYAIKCLSKANLDEDALAAQMTEVTIHQSLKSHPNIVTLHRTLETSSFLLLVLEYVPGEDLFCFLGQARDHYDSDSRQWVPRAPPTPSLLSNTNPSQLFSRTRLRLIASMFCQMCDAVAVCHDQQVFHRDIKPENFIVTDSWTILPDGRQERKVIVKLIDFGLSSIDVESADMDYGSAPYMSYECRNNVAPTYRPRAADVWSLGIILINMLYHCNPWTDTEQGACSSFNLYLRDPVNFFMNRFVGMTRPVAEFLATRIFCVLENPSDDSKRISAKEFGLWIRNLPTLLGGHGMQRTPSNSSTRGNPLQVSTPVSWHRPSSMHPSGCAPTTRTPAIPVRTLSHAPSLCSAYEREETNELSTVLDQEPELVDQPATAMDAGDSAFQSTSRQRRRKRGTRKGKGTMALPEDDKLATLAGVTQNLARELSKASTASSKLSATTKAPSSSQTIRQSQEPVSMYAIPTHLLATSAQKPSSSRPLAASPLPPVIKKPSKWKPGFGKTSSVAIASDESTASSSLDLGSTTSSTSTTVTNVPNLIMSLNPAQTQSIKTEEESARRSRGAHTERPTNRNLPLAEMISESATSPDDNCSGRPLASGASPITSSNWRASMSTMSSAGASTSAFTRYSNSSARSISTVATSVSSTCLRTSVKSAPNQTTSSTSPKNFNPMTDIPGELNEVHRGQYSNAHGDIFDSPPQPRKRKQKDPKLDAINERPPRQKAPECQRRDASTSTTDLGFLSTGKDDHGAEQEIAKGTSQCSGQDVVGFEAMNIIRNIRKLWKCWCVNGEKCMLQFNFTGKEARPTRATYLKI